MRTDLLLLTFLTARPSVKADQGEQDWAVEAAEVRTKSPFVAEWGAYVDTLAGAYDEDATDPVSSSRRPTRQPLDWAPLKYGEVPFLAVLYKKDVEGQSERYRKTFPGEPDPGPAHIEPGKACGGAIITRSTLITVCGCIMTVVSRIFKSKQFDWLFPKRVMPYDINSSNDGYKIYMTHSIIQFRPDFAHQIDDTTGWKEQKMPPTLNCMKTFQEALSWNETQKSARVNSEVVLAHFKPGIGHPIPGQFPAWRPPYFDYVDGSEQKEFARLNLISIGMGATVYTKYPFHSSIQASSLVSRICDYERTSNCGQRKALLAHPLKYICLCPVYGDKELQLTGGVIGWPVIYPNGTLVGLSASDRDPADGRFLVTWLSSEIPWLSSDVSGDIEAYITKDILQQQNELARTYRAKDLDKSFNIYDYGFNPPPKRKSSSFIIKPRSLPDFLIVAIATLNVVPH